MSASPREPPTVKPKVSRKPAPDLDQVYYDTMKEPIKISKLTPQNVNATETLTRLKNPETVNRSLPSDFPNEDENFSLTELVDKYSHLLPLRVKAVSGFMAENEGDPTIYVDDVYNIHAVKQSEVVTIVDSRRQKYKLPLNSAAKFGLVGDSTETYSVLDLHKAELLPPVIVAMNIPFKEKRIKENEILIPMMKTKQSTVIKAFSVTELREKILPSPKEECDILFSTDPNLSKLYLSEVITHVSHLLPCSARLFISQEAAKLPKHLTSKQVTIQQKCTETSLIISLHKKKTKNEEKVYIDIPVSIDIDVRVLRPQTSEEGYAALYQDSNALITEYDPTKLQACVNANDDDTYITQAQLFKALRQGYETAGTKIKTSGVEHIYEPLGQTREAPSMYQGIMFPKSVHNQVVPAPTLRTPSVSMYEEVKPFLEIETPPRKFSSQPPPPAGMLPAPVLYPRGKAPPSIQRRMPPVPMSKSMTSSPTDMPSSQGKTPTIPPKAARAHNKAQPSTVIYDKVPKKPISLAPAIQPRKTTISTSSSPDPTQSAQSKSDTTPPLKSSVWQPTSSTPPRVESLTPLKKPQPTGSHASIGIGTSVSNNAINGDSIKEDKSNYGTALLSINESLRLLVGKMEKMELKQTQFEQNLLQLKNQATGESKTELPLELCSMTQQDVQKLLDGMGMPQYKEAFSKEWVDGEVFKELDDETLEELGVTSKLHRLKLRNVITGVHPLEKFL